MDVERRSLVTGSHGVRLLAVLGHIANAEIKCRTGLPDAVQHLLLPGTLQDLRDWLADRDRLSMAAADAASHQQGVDLAGALSAADLQRLALLLQFRCARHMNGASLRQGMIMPPLLRLEGATNEQLLQLEGGGPMRACFLRRRAVNSWELLQHSQGLDLFGPLPHPGAAAAAYEAALVACRSRRGKGVWQEAAP